MKWNPVYKRELTVSSRSLRMTVILLVFNSVLAIAALFNLYSVVDQVRLTAEIQYSRFLELYIFVSVIEFLMLLFIMPALTSGCISGEREKQTLDLMLTTTLRAGDIVRGKLWTALTAMLLLALSALPVQSLVFVYGGITVMDLAMLFLCHLIVAAFTGGIGIFCSSLFKRSAVAAVSTYTILVLFVAGTFSVNLFAYHIDRSQISVYPYAVNAVMQNPGSGAFLYLLLLNPVITFYVMLNRQAGSGDLQLLFRDWFGSIPDNVVVSHWISISLLVQLVIAVLLLLGATYAITPVRDPYSPVRKKHWRDGGRLLCRLKNVFIKK